MSNWLGLAGESTANFLTSNGYGDLAEYLRQNYNGNSSEGLKKSVEKGFMMSPAEIMSGMFNNQLAYQQYMDTQSFQAQVDQMNEAGLNPALLYGENGGVSSTGGAQAGSTSAGSFANPNGTTDRLMSILGAVGQMAQLGGQLNSQRLNNQSLALDNAMKGYLLNNLPTQIRNENREYDDKHVIDVAEGNLKTENAYNVRMDTYLKAVNIEKTIWESESAKWLSKINEIEAGDRQELLDAQIALNHKLVEVYGAQIENMSWDNALKNQQIKESVERVKEIGKRCNILDKDSDYYDMQQFLACIGTATNFLDVTTEMVQLSGVPGFTREMYSNITGTVFQSINDKWGNTGMYANKGPASYPLMDSSDPYSVSLGRWYSSALGYDRSQRGKDPIEDAPNVNDYDN